MNSDIGYRLYSLPLFYCDYLYPFLLRLFIANEWGTLNKNCIHPTTPPTLNVTAPFNMTILYY
jgi:hypothetical protein